MKKSNDTIERMLDRMESGDDPVPEAFAGPPEENNRGMQTGTSEEAKIPDNPLSEVEQLKKQLEDAAEHSRQLEKDLEDQRDQMQQFKIEVQVKKALTDAGVQDMDYAIYRLNQAGGLKLDQSGTVENLEESIQMLKQQNPQNFKMLPEPRRVIVNKPVQFNGDYSSVTAPQTLRDAFYEKYAGSDW